MGEVSRHEELISLAPQSAMGRWFRGGWIPFLPAGVLDEKPVQQVRLLGEGLVCYRDDGGTIGLIEEFCGHQYVSLKWGYPDDHGLRCCYHDWCYDETGQCRDMPLGYGDPAEERLAAFPVRERGGLLHAYLGAAPPPAPGALDALLDSGSLTAVDYRVLPGHWLATLAGALAAAEAAGQSPELIAPHILRTTKGGDQMLIVAVPADEFTSVELRCAISAGSGTGAPRLADSGRAPYSEAIDVAGATARAFAREIPACGCAGDPLLEELHDHLSEVVNGAREIAQWTGSRPEARVRRD